MPMFVCTRYIIHAHGILHCRVSAGITEQFAEFAEKCGYNQEN